jgi:hypothetical protein
MSDLLTFLETLNTKGVQLVAAGNRLRFRPESAVDKEILRFYKSELLMILEDKTDFGKCQECLTPLIGIPTFDRFVNRFCLSCGRYYQCFRHNNHAYKSHNRNGETVIRGESDNAESEDKNVTAGNA